MAKAIVSIGYEEYVVDAEDALKLYEIIAKAERYTRRYRKREDGGDLHFVWAQDNEDDIKSIRLINDGLYRIAKLAGKPAE